MNTNEELFNQLRAKFSDLTMGDADAQSTTDPKEAQFFTFEYKDHPVSVTLGEKELSVYYSRQMTENQPMQEKTEWFEFIQDIRKFAKSRNLGFDVRDISKSNLEKKDYKYLAQNKIAESRRMWGTSRTSYHPLQTAKVIIKHSKAVDEEQRGARSRNISAIFIQNEEGERFKFPMIHLEGARAMARHVANGGLPYDEFGKYIQEQSMNLAKLRGFSRYINRNDLLNTSNDRIAEVTTQKIDNIKSTIHKLTTQKGYEVIKDSWQQTQTVEMTEAEIAEYRDKLTKKTFDESMLEVLPIIHQAIKEADKDAMKPGDDQTSSAQKNKAYVDTWLKGNNRLILKPNDAADNMLARTKFKDKNIMIASILRDIATRFLPQDDEAMRLNNFAADMDSEIQQQGELFVTPKKDYPQLKATAIQLVKRYIDDLKKMKADPEYKDAVRVDPQELKKYKNIKGQEVGKKDLGYKKKYKAEDSFETWADSVTKEYEEPKKKTDEGTWKAPQTAEDFRDITKLLKDPIPVGVDGDNAQGIMYDHIGDDELMDDLYELSQKKGPEADARQVIAKHAEKWMRIAKGDDDIKVGDMVKHKEQDISGPVLRDNGSYVTIKDSDAETEDDELEFRKSDLIKVAKEGMLGFMAPGKNPQPKYKDRDSKIGVKTYDKPKGAKEPYFKKDKKTKEAADVETNMKKRADQRYQYLQNFLKLEKKPNKTQADKDKMKELKRKMADLSA